MFFLVKFHPKSTSIYFSRNSKNSSSPEIQILKKFPKFKTIVLGFDARCRRFPPNRAAGENLAMNSGVYDVAKCAVDGWINSPGHRKNLLGAFDVCGIGVARSGTGQFYLTQLLANTGTPYR